MRDELAEGLIGHWPLAGECRDHSGNGHHGENRGAGLGAPGPAGAVFDGRASRIEVPDRPSLRVGREPFTVAVWVHTEAALDDGVGDILSCFDPAARRGFHLGLHGAPGVTGSQPNARHLQFGIDAGTPGSGWTDRGRPGGGVFVAALAVHDGALYAGVYPGAVDAPGRVYRYGGGAEWIDCGAPGPANAVTSLAVYEGALYAGVSHYRAGGSALPPSPNTRPGGRVYRYEGGSGWTDCGQFGGPGSSAATAAYGDYVRGLDGWRVEVVDSVHGLAVFEGRLYAIPLYHQGLFRYEGEGRWSDCGSPGVRLMALGVYNGALYAAGNEGQGRGGVYRHDGGRRWRRVGDQPGVDQVYSFAVYEGRLHAGTWPEGRVFRYEGGETWSDLGRLGEEREVMGMVVYNGALYAGTLPLAHVYRYEGGAWETTGRLDTTPGVRYRRAWSMAVHAGKLYCGTLPSGRVLAYEAGRCATWDRPLPPGWRHVAAVRRAGRLALFVDGALVAETEPFDPAPYDLSSGRPLVIGSGPRDHFRGRIRDARLYRRALSAAEVAALARGGA